MRGGERERDKERESRGKEKEGKGRKGKGEIFLTHEGKVCLQITLKFFPWCIVSSSRTGYRTFVLLMNLP